MVGDIRGREIEGEGRSKEGPREGLRWDDSQRLLASLESCGQEVAALLGPLPEGDGGHDQVQEPWQGLLPVREEAQEDTEGRDKDWRENQEQSRREAEDEEKKARDEGGSAHLVVAVVLLIVGREELLEAPQAPQEGEGDALHVPRGGRSRLEQQRRREGIEVERRDKEDHVRKSVR